MSRKIILVRPQIPQNSGTIARLCAATNTQLDLVGPLGFSLSDKYLKRAGLDYWPYVNWQHFDNEETYFDDVDPKNMVLLSRHATRPYTDITYNSETVLIFGSETKGLDPEFRKAHQDRCVLIPMANPNIRSLN
ncbi:MAG: tRNA (uridine(34)/cytosine(34)/5-carboxymethylaminomethyluridine(34)-2'-O)-methyltransferase TrmL [Actinobacteria bacterium]|nr:tRNA (uridine(34)/cytosine(34)/5-carboxymethylaminomethyluridine(34)-2'-O)-methyltransferase TrmL [Actinomycetota bacterium]